MREKFDQIVAITDQFSATYLNEEYARLIRQAVAALCRKRPSPLEKGKPAVWAGGITHAIGMVNFLFDRSQNPHMSASNLYEAFGIGQSAGQGKSKLARDLLGMYQMDPNWSLQSRIDKNPLIWMVTVNGLMVDVRDMPLEVQKIAYEKGLIPHIPKSKTEEI